jgi:retron-type reverse transcriptase
VKTARYAKDKLIQLESLNTRLEILKEQLKISRYLRYVDDFALFSDDRSQLVAARIAIEDYLASLRLKLHPIKSQLFETQCGANFVGFRVLPDRIRVRNDILPLASSLPLTTATSISAFELYVRYPGLCNPLPS